MKFINVLDVFSRRVTKGVKDYFCCSCYFRSKGAYQRATNGFTEGVKLFFLVLF